MCLLSFVIPFRSKHTTNRWDSVSQFLLNTVKNLLQQNHGDIEVHIVGHELPSIDLPNDDRLYFHLSDEPIPEPLNFTTMNRDRRRKVVFGCMQAAKSNPRYIMPVDADDRIHRDLVAFLSEQPHYGAWIINQGHVVHTGLGRHYSSSKYHQLTGSSCILSLEETGIPRNLSYAEYEKCYWFLGGHNLFMNDMAERGVRPKEIPFRAGAYLLGNESNISDELRSNLHLQLKFILRYFILGKKLDPTFHSSFGTL